MTLTIQLIVSDIYPNDNKWQKAFCNYLAYALNEQHNIKITWKTVGDISELGINEVIPTYILSLYSSQNLQSKEWVQQVSKLWEYVQNNENVFFYKILRENIPSSAIPAEATDLKQFELFVQDTKSGELITEETLLSQKINLFLPKIFLLAKEISSQTRLLHQEQSISEAQVPTPTSKHRGQAIFLAQVSPQSARLREKLRQELITQGFRVLPATQYNLQNQEELEPTIRQDLKQAQLIIHLFGETVDIRREGVQQTIEAIQNTVAIKYYQEMMEDGQNIAKRMIWLADFNRLKNEQYKRFINNLKIEKSLNDGGHFFQCAIEEFKDIILERLRNPKNRKKTKINLSKDLVTRQIYLINDVGTEEDFYWIKGFLEDRGYTVVYLNNPSSQIEARAQHEAFLFRSEGIIMLHNEYNTRWVRSKINDIFKVKSKGRKESYLFKLLLSRTLNDLPNQPIYQDIQLIHPENTQALTFLGEQELEKAEYKYSAFILYHRNYLQQIIWCSHPSFCQTTS